MIPLTSPRWKTLEHAYGPASDIPAMLKMLENYPAYENWKTEPYFSLSSALCHQGDIYSASYAAVPHLVQMLSQNPEGSSWALYSIPGAIEQCRLKGNAPEIPDDLSESYFSALAEIPKIVAVAACEPWDELRCRVLVATIAVVKGHLALSEAIDMLDPKTVEELLDQ